MAADYLRQLVEDYNEGRVNLENTLNRLEFLDWADNKKVLPDEYVKVPRNPVDIVIENERAIELRKVLVRLRKELSKQNWSILVMVSSGMTYEAIGKKLGITHQAVSKHLRTIQRHAAGLDELLRRDPVQYEASKPKNGGGSAFDLARSGKKCMVPEYLASVFGDRKVLCCYCERCTRKSDN